MLIPKNVRNKEKNFEFEAKGGNPAFELILFILRDIYIYSVSKNEKILYNEDVADKIKRFASDFGASPKVIEHMMEITVSHIEKINSCNLNKSISADSYFSNLLSA